MAIVDDELEIDVSNDPTIEALGSEECTKFSQRHWQRLMSCSDPSELVLTDSRVEDDRLYKVYAANFGGSFGLDLLHLSHEALHAGGMLQTWRSVLTAMEGRSFGGQPMNMMTLLRAEAHAGYDPDETDLILVPRAQFLLIEVARNREGVYRDLKNTRLTVELGRAADALVVATQQHDATRVLSALHSMATHRVVPEHILRSTSAARLVGAVSKYGDFPPKWLSDDGSSAIREELASTASALRTLWKGGLSLLKLDEAQQAAATEWLDACLAIPAFFSARPSGDEEPRPSQAPGEPAANTGIGKNIPPAAFAEPDTSTNKVQPHGDSIRVWCRMMPASCVLCGVKSAVIEQASYGAGAADIDHTSAATWSCFECSPSDPIPSGLLQWLHVAFAPAASLLLLGADEASETEPPLPAGGSTREVVANGVYNLQSLQLKSWRLPPSDITSTTLKRLIATLHTRYGQRPGCAATLSAMAAAVQCKADNGGYGPCIALGRGVCRCSNPGTVEMLLRSTPSSAEMKLSGVELRVGGLIPEESSGDHADNSENDVECPEENEVDQEVRPKLRAVETTLVEAAGSPMVAAIAMRSGHEHLENVFAEIHKQAMANILLDVTGRIGTRQRDSSATAPRKDSRAATVITPQVVQDFADYGVAVVDGAVPLEGEVGSRKLLSELTEWGKERLQPTFQMQARQDVVGWLSPQDASESGVATTAAMELLRGVAYELNEALNLDLAVPQQCMCACYGASRLIFVVQRSTFPEFKWTCLVCQREMVHATSHTATTSV